MPWLEKTSISCISFGHVCNPKDMHVWFPHQKHANATKQPHFFRPRARSGQLLKGDQKKEKLSNTRIQHKSKNKSETVSVKNERQRMMNCL